MSFEHHEPAESTNRSSDRADMYAPIAANSWNQTDMRALNSKQESSLPPAFGSFELIGSVPQANFPNSNNIERSSTLTNPASKPVEQIELAQDQTMLSDRIYKQEMPPATAERELHNMFPELNSHHTRIAHTKGTIYDHLQEAHKHHMDFEFFRSKVNTYAPWDYKSFYKHPEKHPELSKYHLHGTPAPVWVQNYGNFNYGATAFALGLSEDEALIFAGAAQQGGTEKHPIKSPEGLLAGAKNTLKAAVLPNHGDSDANDQYRIRQGYEWAQKHAIELGISD